MRGVALTSASGLASPALAIGQGKSPLEILVCSSSLPPNAATLRSAWKARNGGRAAPLLLVALHGERASICGPAGDDPPAYLGVDRGQVERICREALEQPDRHAAQRALRDVLPSVEADFAGVRNEGFLATHELRAGARRRTDWDAAGGKARGALAKRGPDLLRALGFGIERHDGATSILRAGDRKVAVAVLLAREEAPDLSGERFSGLSPISYALAVADREGLPWVVVQHGAKIRVHPARVGVGVGRRGRTETYVECHAGLLPDADAAFLWLLCSADALAADGSLEQILEASGRFAGDLAERLRERVYQSVVPLLARGIVAARGLRKPKANDLADTYEMALTVLFRLLFVAYAEDKDLLPYRWNGLYQRRSLKTKAQELAELRRAGASFDAGDTLWDEVTRLFRAVDRGNREWGVPAYDGGLFSEDGEVSPAGAQLAALSLPNTVFGPALADLLLVEGPEGLGPVDFRSLGVREFGTIYEGLLESELSVAETDLAVDKSGAYRPCKSGEEPAVARGDTYLHNASGARKSTGSYFTKHFAVEHLLERSLEPALAEHTARLDALGEEEAGERFFDFRVADLAMGSGHFLVAAVDRIERALTGYLSRRRLPAVTEELAALRAAALEALGPLADQVEIEHTQLLRRLIARRCIYGVDLNPIAVQLARLSIWIHTFVPGLPLSLLDRGLVRGNSLVGIGRLDEVKEKLEEGSLPLFPIDAASLLGAAAEPLKRLARLADATPSDLARARKAQEAAVAAVAPAAALCDLVTAARPAGERVAVDLEKWEEIRDRLPGSKEHRATAKRLEGLQAFHFPIAFPEVFLRERPGFDVIVGNPPWEKARVEELEFWGRHAPGIRGLATAERNKALAELRNSREDLVALWQAERNATERLRDAVRHFPGMNTGHPDLFRAFTVRFFALVSDEGGRVGVVLPGDAFKIKGGSGIRAQIRSLCSNVDVQLLTNKGEWVFDDVDGRKLIALVTARVSRERGEVTYGLPPECHYLEEWKRRAPEQSFIVRDSWLVEYSPSLVIPTLPSVSGGQVVDQLMKSPPLRSHPELRVRRVYADFETYRDRHRWNPNPFDGAWPVYKGESFDIWEPDTGRYFAWTDGEQILDAAQQRRRRSPRGAPYSEMNARWRARVETHPVLHPRIAFRNVTNRTNTRTLLVALIPPSRVNTETAPWVLWLDSSNRRACEGYLLGVMASLVCDWWTRRFVEGHVDEEAFNSLRIPNPSTSPARSERVRRTASRLACPDERFAGWADDVGVSCGPLAPDEKEDMIHELDAVVAHLYGLSEKHLVHIFETFHEGWDYDARLRATLEHFRDWKRRNTP
ncbi:MAG: hypothetical protein EYC70_13125 [Planctomycetota bacterium]|nr:MAG: hypothetical protein EYC70_13125 [Planctomycetota bacterium]